MEKLLLAPYFQMTLAVVVGIGIVGLSLAVLVFKFFLPRLGKALFAPARNGDCTAQTTQNMPPMLINPALCTACEAEHQRSLRNETDIKEVKIKMDDLTKSFNAGLQTISSEIGNMKTEIIKALAART
jgi:hypothetical protein